MLKKVSDNITYVYRHKTLKLVDSKDPEFDEPSEHFVKTMDSLQAFLSDVQSFVKKMDAFVKQFKRIAETLQKYVLEEDTEKFRVMVELYNQKMDNFNDDLIPALKLRVEEDIVKPIKEKIVNMKSIKKGLDDRTKYKMDVLHYQKKVDDLKSDPKTDAVKLIRNEDKYSASVDFLESVDVVLKQQMNHYLENHSEVLRFEFGHFRCIQKLFFDTGSQIVSEFLNIEPGTKGSFQIINTSDIETIVREHRNRSARINMPNYGLTQNPSQTGLNQQQQQQPGMSPQQSYYNHQQQQQQQPGISPQQSYYGTAPPQIQQQPQQQQPNPFASVPSYAIPAKTVAPPPPTILPPSAPTPPPIPAMPVNNPYSNLPPPSATSYQQQPPASPIQAAPKDEFDIFGNDNPVPVLSQPPQQQQQQQPVDEFDLFNSIPSGSLVSPTSTFSTSPSYSTSTPAAPTPNPNTFPYKARGLFEFLAENPDELTIRVGDIVTVIKRENRDWLYGTKTTGEKGIFPESFIIAI